MSLIAISGSQGQGKSTILSSLAELGYKIIPHKTSRSILTEWGLTLNEINKDAELTKKFQTEILIKHIENSNVAVKSNELYFTERSFADIFTYTILAIGSFNEFDQWLDEYYEECKKYQKIYELIIKLNGRILGIEDDGVRSVNRHFTNVVDIILNNYINDFSENILDINNSDHNERIELIQNYIKIREQMI
jgi:guanylate kinase